MKPKRLMSLVIACVCAFIFMPMDVYAKGQDIGAEEYFVMSMDTYFTSSGICHCGAQRSETIKVRIDAVYCSQHGPNCKDYWIFYKCTYHYCQNPNCGDNWYDPWEYYETEHQ